MPARTKSRYVDGILLEKNLYPDANGRPGYYRYRRPDRSFAVFKAKTVDDANEIAKENNEYRDAPKMDRSGTLYAVELYIKYAERQRPSIKGKQSWKKRCSTMRAFANEFPNRMRLNENVVWAWWDGLTHHQQNYREAEFRRMWSWFLRESYVATEINPFDKALVPRRERPPRQRERLSLPDFWRIYQRAGELDYHGLQIAMGVMLYTTLRPGDVVRLRDRINVRDGGLAITISKAVEQKGVLKAGRPEWKFDEHPILADLVQRGLEYGKPSNCPYVVSQKSKRVRASKVKSHSWQLTVDRLGKMFSTVREDLDLGGEHPPSLHEVRSLASFRLFQQGEQLVDISTIMDHEDPSTTEGYIQGHPLPTTRIYTKITDLGGEF